MELNDRIKGMFNKNTFENKLIRKILLSEISYFEAVKKIDSITSDEAFNVLVAVLHSKYWKILCELYFSLDKDFFSKNLKEFLSYEYFVCKRIKIDEDDVKSIQMWIQEIDGIDCVSNVLGFDKPDSKNAKEYVDLNDFILQCIEWSDFWDFDSETLKLFSSFGNLGLLKNVIDYVQKKKANKTPDVNELLDLSDTSGVDKIIYLQQLGIIDFLRTKQPFISVPDKVAQVVSAITGIKLDTVRPMVRPILNNDFAEQRNPLNSKKAVERVKDKLINIGFKPD